MRQSTKAALVCAALGVVSLVAWPLVLLRARRTPRLLSRRPSLAEEYGVHEGDAEPPRDRRAAA